MGFFFQRWVGGEGGERRGGEGMGRGEVGSKYNTIRVFLDGGCMDWMDGWMEIE